MSGLARWRVERRQRRYHEPFRIAEPEWTASERIRLARLLDDVADTLAAAKRSTQSAQSTQDVQPQAPAGPVLREKDLAEAATNLWRAQRRITKFADENPREAKRVGRLLVATHDALRQAGVLIQEHDGDEYHPGLSLEVLAYQDDPSLRVEMVQETVRPSVYLADKRIQMGQVIVGSPAAQHTEDTGEEDASA
ncbi:hypothetical protein [Actinocrispum wychmicini]|uniref:Uncharacterized protein n=1 Tax=Actinocrispum wychmicini TaxID=1213861 RepID=A0A4R2IK58_9PSEU|nr:hypothetical protein [Actinocrispum wychmicini]TCO44208.1 hypothetical protein EV192_12531 [Actinocrispum wychmicini]